MNVPGWRFSAALLFLVALQVRADVMYQCVDDSGHKSFSNIKSSAKGMKCVAMDLGDPTPPPATAKPPAKAASPSPAGFPKVDENSQRARDNDRRRILETELAAEQKNLEQARKDLTEQEGIVLPSERMQYKGGGGIAGGKVEERLQTYRDKVALHERNIEAIQKELSRLR
ncbi:DUF4124 domain-containing protein [Propionivibrio soli]|jgi:hypothetical protein|uniref:DUF4124 domain-containing protein n=1 Tax=Propionivibrio soli TaxID=2976531 RepID=UPI0021E70551|nr:DUF4124 domain-containing protein [Propionivibrio soli]